MRHRPASDFIPCFDLTEAEIEEITQDAEGSDMAPVELPPLLPRSARAPTPDPQQTFEDGRLAGLAEARAEMQEQLERLREANAAALANARQAWADETAATLAAQMPVALAAIGEQLSDRVGRLLRPFLDTELREAASRALIEQITPLLSGADGALIRVSGPKLLTDALRHVIPPERAVAFEESDATDVTITVGETVIETRIEAWIARLEGNGPDRRRRRSHVG